MTASPLKTQHKTLVCGGAGYIGSHVVRALADAGLTPVVVDDLSTGHRQAVPASVECIIGSVGDRKVLDEALGRRDIGAVVHLCACAYVGESMANPRKYYRNNVANGLTLLEAMVDHNVRHIVFSSSCAVYGHPERIPIDENCRTQPISPYGRTKLTFEQMMGDFQQAYGLRWVSLRYFNAAGASTDGMIGEDHDPETHLIPTVLRQAMHAQAPARLGQAETLEVFGNDYDTPDGTCIRDYIHVEDLADAHVGAIRHLIDGKDPVAINLANARGCSVLEIIGICEQVTGAEIPYRLAPRRPGDPAMLIGSARKAKEILNWEPRRSGIENMVLTAWRWHVSHPLGYAKA